MLNLEDIKQILDLVRQHELTEFELEQNGLKLRVRKDAREQILLQPGAAMSPPLVQPAPAQAATPSPAPVPADGTPAIGADDSVELAVVKSPIVGTFYRAPEPGAPPFVDVGALVRKGQVLCIIEAMKLMNEIESEYEGEVVKVYVENGQPVQYGERLFAIKAG
jgi:acetyl-CoA carboxylase biotin carboxyl carrier protein